MVSTEPYTWRQHVGGLGIAPVPSTATDTFQAMLVAPAVAVSLLLDPEPYERNWLPRWAEHHTNVSRQMNTVPRGEERRRTARRRFWNEKIGIYRQAAFSLGRMELPLFSDNELKEFLKGTPMIALLSELFLRRFIDQTATWRDNDLIDMLFLSTAAAHCDYGVGEAHTCTQLRQIQRSQLRPESVATRLSELMPALTSLRPGSSQPSEPLAQSGPAGPAA